MIELLVLIEIRICFRDEHLVFFLFQTIDDFVSMLIVSCALGSDWLGECVFKGCHTCFKDVFVPAACVAGPCAFLVRYVWVVVRCLAVSTAQCVARF